MVINQAGSDAGAASAAAGAAGAAEDAAGVLEPEPQPARSPAAIVSAISNANALFIRYVSFSICFSL